MGESLRSKLKSDCLTLACEIQRIAAPTFHESERLSFVARQFTAAGLADVQIIQHDNGITNTYARLPGGDPSVSVIVSAHADTVFPADTPLNCRLDEAGRLHGPGIGDNSVAVAALIVLAKRLASGTGESSAQQGSLPSDVWFVCNAAEEGRGDLQGMRAAIRWFGNRTERGSIDAAIVLEGMAFGSVYHQGIAVRRYSVTVRAPGGHSWGDFGNPSAIHELTRIGAQISSIAVPDEPRTTFNIGLVSGGTSVNTIAEAASMEIDLRSESTAGVTELEARVLSIIEASRSDQVAIEVVPIGNRPSGEIPREHPLVAAATEALEAVGSAARYPNGSTDVNALLHSGIPAVCVGVTTGSHPHRADEWIETGTVEKGLRQVELLIRAASQIVAGEGKR